MITGSSRNLFASILDGHRLFSMPRRSMKDLPDIVAWNHIWYMLNVNLLAFIMISINFTSLGAQPTVTILMVWSFVDVVVILVKPVRSVPMHSEKKNVRNGFFLYNWIILSVWLTIWFDLVHIHVSVSWILLCHFDNAVSRILHPKNISFHCNGFMGYIYSTPLWTLYIRDKRENVYYNWVPLTSIESCNKNQPFII